MSKAYFVHGGQYLRYDVATDRVDAGYPKPLTSGWSGIEATEFRDGFDSAIDIGNGKLYLFRGSSYLRVDQASNAVDGAVTPIAGAWGGFAEAGFTDGIEAAVNWGNGKAYFMRGDAYIRYDIATDTVDGGPSPIAGNWPGFAEAGYGSGVDALLNWGNGKAYAFKGDTYLRYDMATDRVDDGYPTAIAGNWPGFSEVGFGQSIAASWMKAGGQPAQPSAGFGSGGQVWHWNGMVSHTKDIPRAAWFPGSNPADQSDYLGHGAEIFNYVFHSDGTVVRGRPHMRGKEGSFAWLNRNPGNLTGVPGGPDFGQYRDKFHWHNFLIFPTWDAGYAAIAPFLRGGQFRNLNILQAFEKYAPRGDGGNDPVRYANEAAAAAGLPTTAIIGELTDAQMRFIQDKIVEIEGAIPGATLPIDSPEVPQEVRAMLG